MAEYIDRQKAIEQIKAEWAKLPLTETTGFGILMRVLKSIPAADVRPVVKARWVYTDMSRLVCSNCRNPVAFALKDDGWHHGDFCPNCGAWMEES